MNVLDEQILPVRWVSLNKVASEWAEDSRLQSPHQLGFVIQQLFPFGLNKVSLPGIFQVQTLTRRSPSDHIYAFTKITKIFLKIPSIKTLKDIHMGKNSTSIILSWIQPDYLSSMRHYDKTMMACWVKSTPKKSDHCISLHRRSLGIQMPPQRSHSSLGRRSVVTCRHLVWCSPRY